MLFMKTDSQAAFDAMGTECHAMPRQKVVPEIDSDAMKGTGNILRLERERVPPLKKLR